MLDFTIIGVHSSSDDEVQRIKRGIGDRQTEVPLDIILVSQEIGVAEKASRLREKARLCRDVAAKIDAMADELETQARS